jgi:tetratricopeptide (TPR) repeat protein
MIARLRASFTAVLPFLAVSIGYLGARFHALRGFAPAVHPLSFSEMVLTWPSILWSYARHLFAPWGYSLYYDFSPVQHLLSREFILPFASLVLLLSAAFAVYRLLKVPRDLFLSACVWFTVPLAPCLYLRAIEPYIFGQDRYLYVSVIGFALFVSAVLVRLPSPHLEESASRRLHLYAGAIIGTILACCTLIQQQYWVNNVALFRRAVTIAPHNTPALNNLAVALAERNDFADAIAIFNRDLQQDPNSARLNYNYGYVLYRKQDYGKALPLFSRAAALDPGMGEAFLYIGMSQLKLGDAQDAAVEIRRAIALEPERRGAHLALGAALEAQGNFSGALDETKIEASRFPDDKLINLRLASLEKSSRQQR